MNFLELAKQRYSSRNYKNQKIEKEKMLYVLEAARIAPSAANKQPWHFILIDEPELLNNIKSIYERNWIVNVPAVILICGDFSKAWVRRSDNKNHLDIDIAIAVDHMTLAATDIGLATCWVCNFDVKKCCELFKLPKNLEPIVLLPIGYPDDSAEINRHETARLKIEEIVCWNKFN